MLSIEELEKMNIFSGFNNEFGFELVEYSKGHCIGKIVVRENQLNPWGTVHGGIIYSLADTLGGVTAISEAEHQVVTLTGATNYIGSADGTEIIAEGKNVHVGRTTVVTDVEVRTETGKLVSKTTFTYFIIKK